MAAGNETWDLANISNLDEIILALIWQSSGSLRWNVVFRVNKNKVNCIETVQLTSCMCPNIQKVIGSRQKKRLWICLVIRLRLHVVGPQLPGCNSLPLSVFAELLSGSVVRRWEVSADTITAVWILQSEKQNEYLQHQICLIFLYLTPPPSATHTSLSAANDPGRRMKNPLL